MIPGDHLVRMLADRRSGFAVTPILDPAQIGDASIDIRLGPDIIVSRRATGATAFDATDAMAFRDALRARQTYVRRGLGDSFHLQPGEFAIARSLEYVKLPGHVSAEAVGRSSWGRLGLTIATATMVQPGFSGTITLELSNVANTALVLHVGLRLAQLVFTHEAPARARRTQRPRSVRDIQRRARVEHYVRERQTKVNSDAGRYIGQLKPALSRLEDDRDLLWATPLALRYAVGIVGHRFAGKSSVVAFLVNRRGFRLYRLVHLIRDEAARRGLDPNSVASQRRVGDLMREESGQPDFLARLVFARIRRDLIDADRRREPVRLVIEGFKLVAELDALDRLAAFRPLHVHAEPLTRLERAEQRGWLEAISEPRAASTDEPARLAWLRKNVDEPGDNRYQLEPLVRRVTEHPQVIDVANDGNVPMLHGLLDERVAFLERAWRSGELEPQVELA
ncbi:MAG: dCTP deaminase [Solirubrobacteraceae bacterium]|nr:dCTP deaminase [Solirubrobacteraceae bacterium]